MKLPRALRYAREGIDYRTPSAPLGIYTNGAPGAYRDVSDALQGHRQIDHSTTASVIASMAQAAANSHNRRG